MAKRGGFIMGDAFTEEEKRILEPYFTNLGKPVFAFTSRAPEEVVAVLFSKYSRSAHSIRRNFLDLVKDTESGFGGILDSVGSSGSNESARLSSPLEKSTRYVVFDKGSCCKPAAIMNSGFAEE